MEVPVIRLRSGVSTASTELRPGQKQNNACRSYGAELGVQRVTKGVAKEVEAENR